MALLAAIHGHWRVYVPSCALRSRGGTGLLVPRLSVPRCRERHSEPYIRGFGRRGNGALRDGLGAIVGVHQ